MHPWERSLADDLREHPRPVDPTPHVHFHAHGGTRHSHEHTHPSEHAHSARVDAPEQCRVCERREADCTVVIDDRIVAVCDACYQRADERGGDDE